ncbi:CDK-activating kinase assembly factor [Pseudovirgaria hyperparasitica]|uniref:RNA polymerase II transcription factor B subunit 3 n=1 Tax=Pseudovirgaria hyperparasitica TaxID=470096 RepID=A0A6A6W1E1_9PEZI|nr:CDK-activating kinase assembly factor [Pseudovirgaria hyperparasitica]KAF2755750.1 CDK-activating kinase assembly factor [Pseudovirgaria hyperparasitica]
MSRAVQRPGGAAPKRTEITDDGGEFHSYFDSPELRNVHKTDKTSDICPVCKSSRYLNPQMKFLVNPECYHKMCESCVDRIFSSGPAPCPIAGCRRTLRKAKFRAQTFEDVFVEREVDIRRRVAKVFNRCEEDFETLLDYNDYLNDVEDITYNLINGIDVEASEKKLQGYAEANRQLIDDNENRARKAATTYAARQAQVKEQSRLRREANMREEERERQERLEGQRNIINQLASRDGDAEQIVREGQIGLKRRHKTAIPDRRKPSASATKAEDGKLLYRGLKKKTEVEPERPFSPYAGLRIANEYSVVQDHYDAPWLSFAWQDERYLAGGFKIGDFYSRVFSEAFAGLSVFVDEEVAGRNLTGSFSATEGAVAAADQDVNMSDDIF